MDFGEYEREGRLTYARFAATVASILTATIRSDPRLRLQQVAARAKAPHSLLNKLENRGLSETTTLQDDIKDLAGCRIVFYTNADVSRFIDSGLIHENFEVREFKLHHPSRGTDDAAELYIADHYLVSLLADRLRLPEYAEFEGLRCEIQVQTILNHAWAEMAHDTIYKVPNLNGFGEVALGRVKGRLAKVAQRYLAPAGYEFQRIAIDFERLMAGKDLFDQGALDAILTATDNNVRADALETFAESVLPYYDDRESEYPTIAKALVQAVGHARKTPAAPRETPFGVIPGKTIADIVQGVTAILGSYWYLDIDTTFDVLCDLYAAAETDEERAPIKQVAVSLTAHNLAIWKTHGPTVQGIVVERIGKLSADDASALRPMLTAMLGEMLKPVVTGSNNNSNAITIHQSPITASSQLRNIRDKVLSLLEGQFRVADGDAERQTILYALEEATRTPYNVNYPNSVALFIFEDTATILAFATDVAPTLSFELRLAMEDRAHHFYWAYADLPPNMADDPALVIASGRIRDAAVAFRDSANADPDFVTYKILVGFNSVFPPAWDDRNFGYKEAEDYRNAQLDKLLEDVTLATADKWFAILSRCAETRSKDLATFQTFGIFLTQLGATKPEILVGYIGRMGPDLARFLPVMLQGLLGGAGATAARAMIMTWITEGKYLGEITWQLGSATPVDTEMLEAALAAGVTRDDANAVRNCLLAAAKLYAAAPGTLIEAVFLPALRYLSERSDTYWVDTKAIIWMENPLLLALDTAQATEVLDALVAYPTLSYGAEDVAGTIATKCPEVVIDFLGQRQALRDAGEEPDEYTDLPYSVHSLREPLAASGDVLVQAARRWFDMNQMMFRFRGGRFLAAVFPGFPKTLEILLESFVDVGETDDLAFVLAVVTNFRGNRASHDLLKRIIDKLAPDNRLLGGVQGALLNMGVVYGEFGVMEYYAALKTDLEAWLQDPRETVRTFASAFIRNLDSVIASAQRSAEADIALRRLSYNENLETDFEA